jgi:hypothetical protein
MICDEMCHWVSGVTASCGDGVEQASNEVCDDGNKQCGTCSSNCRAYESAEATGQIVVLEAADMRDSGDSFTLNDGFNPEVVFSLNKTGITAPVVIPYNGSSATHVRNAVAHAINTWKNQSLLLIAATADGVFGSVVTLTHMRSSQFGNESIVKNVDDGDFTVIGMTGGKGGDCPLTQRCESSEDCKSNLCLPLAKTCGCILNVDCPSSAPQCVNGSCVP